MNEKEQDVQQIVKEAAMWKNRALEACEKACFNCEEYSSKNESRCAGCRIAKIKEEAGNEPTMKRR